MYARGRLRNILINLKNSLFSLFPSRVLKYPTMKPKYPRSACVSIKQQKVSFSLPYEIFRVWRDYRNLALRKRENQNEPRETLELQLRSDKSAKRRERITRRKDRPRKLREREMQHARRAARTRSLKARKNVVCSNYTCRCIAEQERLNMPRVLVALYVFRDDTVSPIRTEVRVNTPKYMLQRTFFFLPFTRDKKKHGKYKFCNIRSVTLLFGFSPIVIKFVHTASVLPFTTPPSILSLPCPPRNSKNAVNACCNLVSSI